MGSHMGSGEAGGCASSDASGGAKAGAGIRRRGGEGSLLRAGNAFVTMPDFAVRIKNLPPQEGYQNLN